MTITEFLTARLDEDKADAEEGDLLGSDIGARAADRILADIAAKRAIVDFMSSELAAGSGLTDAEGIARSLRAIAVLRHLASVYPDHEQFDPAWNVGSG